MKTHVYKTVPLEEPVAVFFDKAAESNADPREMLRLATQAAVSLFRSPRRGSISLSPLCRKVFDQEQCTRRIK